MKYEKDLYRGSNPSANLDKNIFFVVSFQQNSKSKGLEFCVVSVGRNIVLQRSCKHYFEHSENIVARKRTQNEVALCTNSVMLRLVTLSQKKT